MRGDAIPQLSDAHVGIPLRLQYWRIPSFAQICQLEHRRNRRRQLIRALPVRLIDDVEVGDFHHAGFQRLYRIPRFRRHGHDDGISHAHYPQLGLADAYRLNQDDVLAGGVQRPHHAFHDTRQPARLPSRRHAANEHAVIQVVPLHPNPVPQQRAPGERAGRVNGQDAHRQVHRSQVLSEPVNQRAFAHARRPGNPHGIALPGVGVQPLHHLSGRWIATLQH